LINNSLRKYLPLIVSFFQETMIDNSMNGKMCERKSLFVVSQ